jgi:hypothetical protein
MARLGSLWGARFHLAYPGCEFPRAPKGPLKLDGSISLQPLHIRRRINLAAAPRPWFSGFFVFALPCPIPNACDTGRLAGILFSQCSANKERTNPGEKGWPARSPGFPQSVCLKKPGRRLRAGKEDKPRARKQR